MGVDNKQVLIITLGPVQHFIAQARKTRDLWYGSHLLAELSKVAANAMVSQPGVELIFPNKAGNILWEDIRVANKIVGVVDTGQDAREVAIATCTAVVKAWIERSDKVKNELQQYINTSMWDRQIKDFIECYAVWTPYNGSNINYSQAIERADQLMAARKSFRDFRQNEPGTLFGDKKSRLNSGRESVIWPEKLHLLAKFGITKDETLDAISLVKRLSNRTDPRTFPSVCDMAFLPYRNDMQNHAKIRDYYEAVRHSCRALQLDGKAIDEFESALFYENRVEEFVAERLHQMSEKRGSGSFFTNKEHVQEQNQVTEIVTSIAQLRTSHEINKNSLPNYYAFIMCDGDNMGETLRAMKTKEEHQKFSQNLSRFALAAEEIVSYRKRNESANMIERGKLVYSGGDDIMAYVALSDCMDVCDKLQRKFTEIMNEAVPQGLPKPTLSIGVAIVHMMERLEVACEIARRAEHFAKSSGKNRMAVIMQKRHGGTLSTISLPFGNRASNEESSTHIGQVDVHISPTRQIEDLQTFYRKGYFSTRFPHELREMYLEYTRLMKGSAWLNDVHGKENLMLLEVERLLRKKKPAQVEGKDYATLIEWVKKCFQTNASPLEQMRELAEKMIIAVMIEKEGGSYEEAHSNSTI
ncbi:type III-B CRISPR-associated protein Cas10/Cmr2 [Paenibacillus sp. GSMTC-2017]|uniref:type III-B CRISPR-associated protein Cas10/Cmr2 n=1 Tax=Paenibacillus sp. GSMTC-2017 TaxID=2794350 RepID=UPI0018D897EF|nr:type III-B CRISPR-associated protein Cas10/Cmr2 [Paenibacillus sp. GSMTC-2017]MBH5320419.1 type III-B CRISPR-associated protein Cas10/Cmr2 [Paenibacillus sp. GSMTC-2017]